MSTSPRSYNSPPPYEEDIAFVAGAKRLERKELTSQTLSLPTAPSSKLKEDSPVQSEPSSGTYAASTQDGESYSFSVPITNFRDLPIHATWSGLEAMATKPMSKPSLPDSPEERKGVPIVTGVLDYFPLAVAEVARVSLQGNKQHFPPGTPLHWERGLSNDHADAAGRHLIQRGTRDTDGMRHSAKMAWRALALLETELENEDVN